MVFWGGVCGVFGATIGCPLYMVKTQMQSQSYGKFAVGYQHNHSGMVNALVTIYKSHGTSGLWRGCQGIVPRTAVGSAIQISTFMTCKDFLQQYEVCSTKRTTKLEIVHPSIHSFLIKNRLKPIFAGFWSIVIRKSAGFELGQWYFFEHWYDTIRCCGHTSIQSRCQFLFLPNGLIV